MPCRRLFACLFIVLLSFPVLARAEPSQRAQHLQEELVQAAGKEDWDRALKIGLELHPLNPREGATAYNLALIYEKLNQPDKAAEWLITSGKDGFAGATLVNTTPELAKTRQQARDPEAIALIRANRAKGLDKFKAEAERIEPLVVLPPRHDKSKPAPLIIALHGTGGTGREMADVWRAPAAELGAVLVCPDALRPMGNGFHWMFIDESEWLVLHTAEWAKSKYAIDDSRMILTGFSQGANVTIQVTTSHPDAFDGAIVCCGHYESHVHPLPEKDPGQWPRYALLTGEHDEGAASNREFENLLKTRGVAVNLEIYKGLGHAFPRARDRELKEAVKFVLDMPARK